MHGKFTSLNFTVRDGHIEDLLPIFVTGHEHPSPLAGETNLTAQVTVPPGASSSSRRLELEGDFDISDGHFEKKTTKTRGWINSALPLWERKKKHTRIRRRLIPLKASLAAPRPCGATQHDRHDDRRLVKHSWRRREHARHINVVSQKIDFHGTVRTKCRPFPADQRDQIDIREVLDPFFRKKRGTVVPVEMSGTYRNPHFGLDLNPVNK